VQKAGKKDKRVLNKQNVKIDTGYRHALLLPRSDKKAVSCSIQVKSSIPREIIKF